MRTRHNGSSCMCFIRPNVMNTTARWPVGASVRFVRAHCSNPRRASLAHDWTRRNGRAGQARAAAQSGQSAGRRGTRSPASLARRLLDGAQSSSGARDECTDESGGCRRLEWWPAASTPRRPRQERRDHNRGCHFARRPKIGSAGASACVAERACVCACLCT
jgi:hypothetical protein